MRELELTSASREVRDPSEASTFAAARAPSTTMSSAMLRIPNGRLLAVSAQLRQNFHTNHHLRSAQQAPVPAASQQQHVQQAVAEQKKHPSAVGHPALRNAAPRRANDKALYLTFFGLLFGIGPLCYWYWQYRQDHMRRKKEEMLADIRARYQARGG